MKANPILLQKKYARVVEVFAKNMGMTLNEALDFFYLYIPRPQIRVSAKIDQVFRLN